eukprot:1894028-Rhodomonas_salina.3
MSDSHARAQQSRLARIDRCCLGSGVLHASGPLLRAQSHEPRPVQLAESALLSLRERQQGRTLEASAAVHLHPHLPVHADLDSERRHELGVLVPAPDDHAADPARRTDVELHPGVAVTSSCAPVRLSHLTEAHWNTTQICRRTMRGGVPLVEVIDAGGPRLWGAQPPSAVLQQQ